MNKLISTVLLFAVSLSLQARTMDEVVSEVLENDPVLTGERARLRGLEDEIHAANTLAGPEIGFDYKWGLNGVGNKVGLEVAQSFDWPGLYRARSRQASMQAGAYATLYRVKEVEQALTVRNAVYALLAARADMELLSKWEKNLEELSETYNRMLQRGETTILEVNKLKLEIFEAHTNIAQAQARLSAAEADLQALNGGAIPANLPADALESLRPKQWYVEQLIASDPEVAASRRQFELAQQEARVTSLSAAPGFSIGYVFENEGGEKFHGFSVGITLPTWNNRAASRASEAKLIAVMAENDMIVLNRQAGLNSSYATAEKTLRLIETGKTLFGSQSDYMEVLRKAFEGGKINLLDFIREENDYLRAALDYNALCLDFNQAAASLNRNDFNAHD